MSLAYGACGNAITSGAMMQLQAKTNTECLLDFLPELKRSIRPYTRRPIFLGK
jgi:hypothetical protein